MIRRGEGVDRGRRGIRGGKSKSEIATKERKGRKRELAGPEGGVREGQKNGRPARTQAQDRAELELCAPNRSAD